MKRTTICSALAAGASLFVLAACGKDVAAPSTPVVSDAAASADIAVSQGADIAADVGDMLDGVAVAGVSASVAPLNGASPMVAASPATAVNCTMNGQTMRHTCSASSSGTVTVTRSFTFLDTLGQPMANYDDSLTAAIHFQWTVDGSFTGTNFSAVFHKSRDHTVSGLFGTETSRTWNGLGTKSDTSTFTGVLNTRAYAGSASDSVRDVVVNLPRSSNPWPMSGEVVRHYDANLSVTGARNETRVVSRRIDVTFNGTNLVPIMLGDGTGAKSCTLNLETRAVTNCS